MMGTNSKKQIGFVLFFVVILWPLLFLFFGRSEIVRSHFSSAMQTDAFRLAERELYATSCLRLEVFDHIDLLIVGSSHVGMGIDTLKLARAWPDKTVALCAWPAWSTDNFAPLLGYLARHQISVGRIVWIADQGSLMHFASVSERMGFSRSLDRGGYAQNRYILWLAEMALQVGSFSRSAADDLREQKELEKAFASLDPQKVLSIVSGNDLKDEKRLRALVSNRLTANPDVVQQLRSLCDGVTAHGTALSVAIYPLPPPSKAMLQAIPGPPLPALADVLELSLSCADPLIDLSFHDWGLDLRHLVDLRLPVAPVIFGDESQFAERYAHLSGQEKTALYNADHLNPLGAKAFTDALISYLKAQSR